MLGPSLFYIDNIELLSIKQRQQLIQYKQDIIDDNYQNIFGY